MDGIEQEQFFVNNKDFQPPLMVVTKKYWLFLQDLLAAYTHREAVYKAFR